MKKLQQRAVTWLLIILLGCNSQDTLKVIEVFTGEAAVNENIAEIAGIFQNTIINVDYNGDVSTSSQNIMDHGHCWSTDSLPTLSNNLISFGEISQTDTFYSRIENLEINTKYYARAFVIADNTIFYGNTISFITNEVEEEPEEEEPEEEEPEDKSYWTEKKVYPNLNANNYEGFSIRNHLIVGLSDADDDDENVKFWKYNTNNDNWIKIADFDGTPVTNSVMLSYNGKGYLIGGSRLNSSLTPTDQFYEYDFQENKWDDLDDFEGRSRRNAMGFRLENDIYYGLGERRSDIWKYDIDEEEWEQLKTEIPDELQRRESAITFTYSNIAFIGFGEYRSYFYDLWSYNPNSNEWKRMRDFPGSGRIVKCVFTINNAAYFVGGDNDNSIAENWKYNINTNEWTKLEDDFELLNNVLFGRAVNNKGYALFNNEKSFWRFDAPTD